MTWYKKVATRVAEQVRMSGGTAMQRIRLPDEQVSVSEIDHFCFTPHSCVDALYSMWHSKSVVCVSRMFRAPCTSFSSNHAADKVSMKQL